MKVVIVGGVAGGATAAARIRRLDEHAQIVVFERSGYISYANCGMPYYIGGIITDAHKLTPRSPESFWKRFQIDMRIHYLVTAIHPDRKCVSVRNLITGKEFEESYDKLLLTPGATPILPEHPISDVERIFSLRTIEDTHRIKDHITLHRPQSVLIAGGGFIGLEMAENLRALGLEVTIVHRSPYLMTPFDPDMAAHIHQNLRRHGIRLLLGMEVEGFVPSMRDVEVQIKDSAPVHAQMVILSIGVQPDTELARDAGLTLGIKNAIVVNDRMETSHPDIYAAGDAVQVKHMVNGAETYIALAGPANKQGRIAADNICGGDSHYKGSLGSSVIKFFDMTAACTGLNEVAARKAGLDVDKVILSPESHAAYYPGAHNMTMKIIFEKGTYRLLGAQIIGHDGVDKRIDVLVAAIKGKLTATDLQDLDLAYAPPYSSAKDPVNIAGNMVSDIAKGYVKQWYLEEVDTLPRDGSVTLLDVRSEEDFAHGHIDDFINIPLDELRRRLSELPIDKPVYVICFRGQSSYMACRILAGHGFDCFNFTGGFGHYDTFRKESCLVDATSDFRSGKGCLR